MAIEIKVPRLGWSMEEGTFVEWLKREGQTVQAGEPLFAIEGDKAVQEVEAIGSGILRLAPRAPEIGETVKVGTTLAFLTRHRKRPRRFVPGDDQTVATTANGRPRPKKTRISKPRSSRPNRPWRRVRFGATGRGFRPVPPAWRPSWASIGRHCRERAAPVGSANGTC